MKNSLIVLGTILIIGLGNLVAAYAFQLSFLDIAIPFGGLALAIVYFFKSKGGMASRRMDMAIQGQTGIRMDQQSYTSERSYIFIGSLFYLLLVVAITFYTYREYFLA
ncbi:hypothetical protein LG326_17090 (plasmid) [Metaplanococcus flavidus]